MRGLAVAVLAAALVACGENDDDDGNGFQAPSGGQCAARTGAYTLKFVEKSGDCGPVDDQIVAAGGAPDPACSGGPVDADTCTVTSDVTCDQGDGTNIRGVGQVRWDQAGNRGTGTWQFTVTDGTNNVLCQSIYDVTATR